MKHLTYLIYDILFDCDHCSYGENVILRVIAYHPSPRQGASSIISVPSAAQRCSIRMLRLQIVPTIIQSIHDAAPKSIEKTHGCMVHLHSTIDRNRDAQCGTIWLQKRAERALQLFSCKFAPISTLIISSQSPVAWLSLPCFNVYAHFATDTSAHLRS